MIGELVRRLAESGGAGLVAGLGLLAAYLMPLAIAATRGHRYTRTIGAMTLALGWTVIGWFAALFWALNRDLLEQAQHRTAAPLQDPPLSLEPVWNDSQAGSVAPVLAATRTCPYCAEAIKLEAVVCRYCARDLAPAPEAVPESAHPASLDERGMQELYDLLQEMERDASRASADARLDELLLQAGPVRADPVPAAESRPGPHGAGEPGPAPVERLRPDDIPTDGHAGSRKPDGKLSAGRMKKAG